MSALLLALAPFSVPVLRTLTPDALPQHNAAGQLQPQHPLSPSGKHVPVIPDAQELGAPKASPPPPMEGSWWNRKTSDTECLWTGVKEVQALQCGVLFYYDVGHTPSGNPTNLL